MRIRTFVAGVALAALMTLAVGGPASAATSSVTIADFSFSPATVTISVGDSVVWTNNGPSPHTTTANGGAWDSGIMNVGNSFTHTFNSAGTFAYHCTIHPFMTGTVIVGAGGGTGTLPSTGAGPGTAPLAWLGVLFLLSGGVVLYVLRRRRA